MSHRFGDLITQHLSRKHGLSQGKLARGILQDQSVISKMCKGELLTGPQARQRVLAIISWLHEQGVLTTRAEANALLAAAGLADLEYSPSDVNVQQLLRQLPAEESAERVQMHSDQRPLTSERRVQQPSEPQTASTPTSDTATSMGIHWPSTIPNERYYRLAGPERDLNELLHSLQDPQGPPVIVIDGLGGMGKTALTVELARRAINQKLFEGVIGDSAKQTGLIGSTMVQLSSATLDFDSLLNTIARQLGRWELPTLRSEEKRAALAHLLQKHRYLVLVDNLETAENAAALVTELRGFLNTSRAIVSSRKQVRHDFVRSFSVHGFEQADSLVFLRTDAEQRKVQQVLQVPELTLVQIHDITGGAPLALKLVVGQAQSLDVSLILRQLEHAGTDLYPYIFRQSWEQLSSAAQRALIYIGRTVVTTAGWEELSSVGIAEHEDQLITAIDELVGYSLLEVSSIGPQLRYGTHQLTRQFINNDLPGLWRQQGLL